MYKKLISSILVVGLLNLLGCYSSELVSNVDYAMVGENNDNIKVVTKDSKEYTFSKLNYYVENDTLYGKFTVGNTKSMWHENIALSEIESIHYYNFNGEATLVLVLGIVSIIAIIYLIGKQALDDMQLL